MKKFMKGIGALAIALLSLVGCTSKSTQQLQEAKCPIKIGLVTDTNGIDDMGINQESWNAISAYAKDQGLSVSCYSYLQATSESDFIPFLSQMGEDEMDIVIVPGSTISSVLEEVATNYPSTSYVALASIEASNVVAVEFDHDSPMYLAGVTAALKAVARDFKCPVLVLSQLNRSVEQSKEQIPQMSNLRESGSIEQDADVVMFIHRPDYGKMQEAANGESGTDDPNATSDSPVSLIIAKNRNGRLATIDFMFQKHIGRFVEMDMTH